MTSAFQTKAFDLSKKQKIKIRAIKAINNINYNIPYDSQLIYFNLFEDEVSLASDSSDISIDTIEEDIYSLNSGKNSTQSLDFLKIT